MGNVVHLNFRSTQPTHVERSSCESVVGIEGSPRRCLNAALYNIGFDDHLCWQVSKPFRQEYTYRGIIASPDVVAVADDGRVRLVKMMNGDKPKDLSAHTVIAANLDCWVLRATFARRPLEMWIVFDDGGRFELRPAAPLAQAHAELAMREMRVEGLYELSTSEAAALVIPA